MVKPLVFSYRQYEELREAYKALLEDNQKLMADNKKLRTQLQIATRIIEDNSSAKACKKFEEAEQKGENNENIHYSRT